MFLGVVPDKCISQIIRSIDFSLWPEIYTCCSGTFRFERAIVGEVPGMKVTGNDVSVFSVPLGRYVLGEETPLEFVGQLAPLEQILEGKPYIDRLAALMVASDYAKFKAGRPNRFKVSHAWHYENQFLDLIAETRTKVDKVLKKVELAGFYAGDWVEHMRNGIAKGAGIVAFPPFFKCLAPDHRLLTADMRWVPCGDLQAGDRLLAFSEDLAPGGRCRSWEYSTVMISEPAIKECVRVHLANGETIICTSDHPWLADVYDSGGHRKWVEADQMRGKFALRMFEPWASDASYEAGWLAGMFDGEGSVVLGDAPKLTISQRSGPAAELIKRRLLERGFEITVSLRPNGVEGISIAGGMPDIFRALGTFRPGRLLSRLDELDVSTVSARRHGDIRVKVEEVERVGRREIQNISTSSRTYIGEGYLMHNSGYEKMFEFLNQNIAWDAPKYDLYDPKDLQGLVDEVAGSGVPYCILSDQRLEGHDVVTEYLASARLPHYCYASTGHPSYRSISKSGAPFSYKPVEVRKLTANSTIQIIETNSDRMNFLKDVYLKKTIQHVTGMANFLVYIDGMLAGGMIYALSKYGENDTLYVLSDFSLTGEARLAKLIAKMTLSHTIIGQLEKRYLWRYRKVQTTAFTHNAVSMKYRGVLELKSRKPATDPSLGNMINYEGQVISDTPEQVYKWWWDKHGRKAIAA